MSKKNWKRVFPGIWRNKSGTLYERPEVDGRWTFRSLKTFDLEAAKAEFYRRRAGQSEQQSATAQVPPPTPTVLPTSPTPQLGPEPVLVGQIIQRYEVDGHRDRQRQRRPATTEQAEASFCRTLLKFWKDSSAGK